METAFRKRFRHLSKWFAALFVLLLVFRLIYGYVETGKEGGTDYRSDVFRDLNSTKNYASEKLDYKKDIGAAANAAASQKYEKTATIQSKTADFERDEQLVKTQVRNYGAIIQYEQNKGQKGSRQIHLLIGVNPAKFDSFYLEMKKIGLLKSAEITKVDKTNEYRELNAKKASIEKTLQSLNDLKAKGGQIADFVALNDKILEIEEKAQELGVELGNFDTENEFCTVKMSMFEGKTDRHVSFLYRFKVAFEWTIRYFAVIVGIMLVASLTIFILLVIVDKLKIMTAINNKLNG